MKMCFQSLRWLAIAVCVLALVGVGLAAGRQLGGDVPSAVALEQPAFLFDDDLRANAVGEKIQDEAGIAAYFKAPNSLNLELIRPLFNSIELETESYILGSVTAPGYEEHFDVHVYARSDGWIMAYYLSSAPTSKMIDTTAKNLDNSKLKTVMNNVTVTGGAPFGAVTYYNFNYPNATHMLLVGEDLEVFDIIMPSSYSYYELSWASTFYGSYDPFVIDGKWASYIYAASGRLYGIVPLVSFLPDVIHNVDPAYYGALVVIYRMP